MMILVNDAMVMVQVLGWWLGFQWSQVTKEELVTTNGSWCLIVGENDRPSRMMTTTSWLALADANAANACGKLLMMITVKIALIVKHSPHYHKPLTSFLQPWVAILIISHERRDHTYTNPQGYPRLRFRPCSAHKHSGIPELQCDEVQENHLLEVQLVCKDHGNTSMKYFHA